MNKQRYTAIHNYISTEDLLKKLGYRTRTPRIGSLGRKIMEASKNHRSVSWLKYQLDTYFKDLRAKRKGNNNKNGN